MSKNKCIKLTILLFLVVISNVLVFKYCNLDNKNINLRYKLISDVPDTYQVFYGENTEWKEEQSEKAIYSNAQKQETLEYAIPKNIKELRLDLGNQPANINIKDIELSYLGENVVLDENQILDKSNQAQIGNVKKENNSFNIEVTGTDAYITYKINPDILGYFTDYQSKVNNLIKAGICILIDFLFLIVLRKSRSVFALLQELNNNKILIWSLSKNDFKTKFAGSYLGIVWAFIQPIVTILVYWFVFQIGLKAGSPIKGIPFALWFIVGLVPWFFFQEALLNATNCMIEYSYLVKKVVFKISILPIVKIVSALFVHLVFIMFLFGVAIAYGFYPSQYTIQFIYYSFCVFILVLALSYATSAIVIFFKDLGQLINIFLQIGMWMTPIMWSYTIIPEQYQWMVKLNPMYYVVEGYRDTFIKHVWFLDRYFQTAYFWIITLGLFACGAMIFRKLKPHFADVL